MKIKLIEAQVYAINGGAQWGARYTINGGQTWEKAAGSIGTRAHAAGFAKGMNKQFAQFALEVAAAHGC